MGATGSTGLVVAIDSALAGIAASGGLSCLAIWLYDRRRRMFLWAGIFAVALSLALLGSVVVDRTRPEVAELVAFLRSTLYGVGAVLAVWTAARAVPLRDLRWISRAMLVVLAIHPVVWWWSSDLLVVHDDNAGQWPQYVPLVLTLTLFNAGVAVAGVLVHRHHSGRAPAATAACGALIAVLTIGPLVVSGGVLADELLTLNVIPGCIAVLLLAGRALLVMARQHDALVRRQDSLLRLSQKAVAGPVDTVRRHVERELRSELGPDVVVALSGADRFPQPGMASTTVRVSGRRQRAVARGIRSQTHADRQFVEAALRILLAASERALGDADQAHAAGHDHVTGLSNLVALSGRLDDRLHAGDWPLDGNARFVLVQCRLVGLEHLAAVDGPGRVESLIRDAAEVLTGLRRSRTIVARIAADTFCVADQIPPGEGGAFLAGRLAEIRAALTAALPGDTVSIGAAEARSGASAASLLRDAAMALDVAPAGGDAVFDDAIAAEVRARETLKRDLSHALDRDELEVYYQPVVAAGSRKPVAVEALARWRRHGELVPTDMWIPAAERLGIIHGVGRRVLEIAARDQHRLGVPVAVNVSRLELDEDTFVADVLDAIGDCPPGRVILEITEGAMMADLARSVAVLQELRAKGIRVALDDFGSCYSSLGALADLPIDILKLDASFVARLEQTNGVAVVQAVISLGRSLGKPIVAEGIETEAQFTLLAALGVDRVQGYLLGRPAGLETTAASLSAAATTQQPSRQLVPSYSSSVR